MDDSDTDSDVIQASIHMNLYVGSRPKIDGESWLSKIHQESRLSRVSPPEAKHAESRIL